MTRQAPIKLIQPGISSKNATCSQSKQKFHQSSHPGNDRVTIRRRADLPDESKDDVRGTRNGHRPGLLPLERHGEEDLTREAEDGQEDHQVAVPTAGRQAELVQRKGRQGSLNDGKGSERRHDDGKVDPLPKIPASLGYATPSPKSFATLFTLRDRMTTYTLAAKRVPQRAATAPQKALS